MTGPDPSGLRSAPPLATTQRRVTREALAAASPELWRTWFGDAVHGFTTVEPANQRIRAFAPLVINPLTQSPAGEIVGQIRKLVPFGLSIPANAAVEVLHGWSPVHDGWRGAALLMQIALRLNGRGLPAAIFRVITRAETLKRPERQALAYLAVRAAAERYKRNEITQLARLLVRHELLAPRLAGELALLVAREDFAGLDALPNDLLAILPGIADEPHQGAYANAIANRLRATYSPEDLEQALRPREENNDAAGFRRELAQIIAPWIVVPLNVPISEATEREFNQRIAAPRPDRQWVLPTHQKDPGL